MTFSKENIKNLQISEKDQLVQSLLKSIDLFNFGNKDFLERISLLIDFSFDLKRSDGLNYAIIKLESFLEQDMTNFERSIGHYFLANAYSNKKSLKINANDVNSKWENTEIEKEILNYRLALKYLQSVRYAAQKKNSEEEIFYYNLRYCQINTNLGNLMNNIGRFAEAIEYRNNALSVNPKFGMALGSNGLSYLQYAPFLYDGGHQSVFFHTAFNLLKSSLNSELEYGASEQYQKGIEYIQSNIEKIYLDQDLDLKSFSIGESEEEINYRSWCLQNFLFLNPLNDIGPYPIAARDILSIPTIVTKINEGPNCQILFNLLKQEFVTARYYYYQGISGKTVHFSDKDVFLFDTEEHPVYSKASEEIKISFRICYSILDKIAFFLNYYFKLGINKEDVDFKGLWYTQKKNNKKIRLNLVKKNNLPLIGLFWISKDLFEKDTTFSDALEPDAKDWYDIRNYLEHKFLKLQLVYAGVQVHSTYLGEIEKNLTYTIKIHDFERKSLKLLKTVRSALIYLTLAMRQEEFDREKTREKKGKTVKIRLKKFPDELKINDYSQKLSL